MAFSLIELQRTAMHEAGHVVMAIDVGVEVYSVSIVGDGHVAGNFLHAPVSDRERVFILLAGPFAEIWAGVDNEDDWRYCGQQDMDKINADAQRLVEIGEWREDEVQIYMNALSKITNKRLERLRPKIEVLAKELLIRQTMTGNEIEEVLRDGT
jgi:ATP-dependent Zn protease